jgi:ribokinase
MDAFKNSPRALHYVDPADFETRRDEFRDDLVRFSHLIDIISLNENEANSLLTALELEAYSTTGIADGEKVRWLKESAKKLASKISVNTIIHTSAGSVWSDGRTSVHHPTVTSSIIQ